MYYGGIDVGSLTAQALILDSNRVVASRSMRVKPNPVDSAETVMGNLLSEMGLGWGDLTFCISTGFGREQVEARGLAQSNVSEISCHGYGAFSLIPSVRTVIDIGGQDSKVIKIGPSGELLDFVMNEKCAAGTGRFLEVQARTLGLELEELGRVSLGSKNPLALASRCSIFCETEVLHFKHSGCDTADIAAGINKAMAERVAALVRRVGIEKEVTMTGGVAKNAAVSAELEKMLGIRVIPYDTDSQIVGALGAALFARKADGSR